MNIQVSKTMNIGNNKAKAFDLSPTLNIFQQKQEASKTQKSNS